MLSKNSKRSLWRRPRAHLPQPKLKCCPLKEVAQQTPPAQHHQPAKSVATSCINKRLSSFDARLSLVEILSRFHTLDWLLFWLAFLIFFLNILYVIGLVCCSVMSSIYYLLLLILMFVVAVVSLLCCCLFFFFQQVIKQIFTVFSLCLSFPLFSHTTLSYCILNILIFH